MCENDEKMIENVKMRRCEDEKMGRCEDEKIFDRRPLLEEPCAQTLSGIKSEISQCNQPKKAIPHRSPISIYLGKL